MSIRIRLMALMAGFAAMALIVTGLGLKTLSDYRGMMDANSRAWENSWRGERLNHLYSNVVMESRGMYSAADPSEVPTFAASLNANLDAIEALLHDWKAAGPDENSQVTTIEPEVAKFIAVRREMARLALAGHEDQAHALGLTNRADRMTFQSDLDAFVARTRAALDAQRQRADTYSRSRVMDFLATALIGIVLILGISLWVLQTFITRPLQGVARAIVDTAHGDYSTPLPERPGRDEMSAVWRAGGTLKTPAIEAERLAELHREAEMRKEIELRQIMLD